MDILHTGRGTGKTSYLVERSAHTGEIIVCMSGPSVERIRNLAKKKNLDIPLPITYREFLGKTDTGRGRNYEKGFVIDEVDSLIRFSCGVCEKPNIKAATLTHNEEPDLTIKEALSIEKLREQGGRNGRL